MKKIFLILIAAFIFLKSFSRIVGIGTTTPDSRAILDVRSTSKGILFPQLTTAQRDAISNPPNGMHIFNTDDHFNTNHWRTLIDPSNNYVFEYNDNLYTYINPTTGAYINPSDARLKNDITPLESMLGKVMALVPKKFPYKTNSADDPLLWGFIAQDVQKIFPEFVDVKDDGYLGISYTNFSVLAIKAIQEQQQEIELLKKQNELLIKRMEILEKKNQ